MRDGHEDLAIGHEITQEDGRAAADALGTADSLMVRNDGFPRVLSRAAANTGSGE